MNFSSMATGMIKRPLILGIVFVYFAGECLFSEDKEYEWTNKDGKTIKAKFLSSDGKRLTISKDGREYVLQLQSLSEESAKLARTLPQFAPKNVYGFVEDLCTTATRSGYVARWAKNPTLSVMDASKVVKKETFHFNPGDYAKRFKLNSTAFKEVVSAFNDALIGTDFKIEVVDDNNEQANIKVFFSNTVTWKPICSKYGMRFYRSKSYFTYTWLHDQNHKLTKALLLFSHDHQHQHGLQQSYFFNPLGYMLGLGSSERIGESVLAWVLRWNYSHRDPGYFQRSKGNDLLKLTTIDREVLRFFHTHLQGGENKSKFKSVYKKHWNFSR